MTFRRPRSLPIIARRRNLRIAGMAEVNRLKHDLTLLMLAPPAPPVLRVIRGRA